MIPTKIVIHHSASSFNTTIDDINAWHKLKFNFPSSLGSHVGYHMVIMPDGKLYQCRRENEVGAHSIPNDGKIGICLVGNFMTSEPKDAQLNKLYEIVEHLKKTYNISEVWGHRDCNKTECPGDNLYKYTKLFTKINWLQRLIQKLLKPRTNA